MQPEIAPLVPILHLYTACVYVEHADPDPDVVQPPKTYKFPGLLAMLAGLARAVAYAYDTDVAPAVVMASLVNVPTMPVVGDNEARQNLFVSPAPVIPPTKYNVSLNTTGAAAATPEPPNTPPVVRHQPLTDSEPLGHDAGCTKSPVVVTCVNETYPEVKPQALLVQPPMTYR